jgi:hypothetical protein
MQTYNLTLRDIEIVIDVYKHRYLSVSQIQTLHFPSRRTAYRRLSALTQLGFLQSFTVPGIGERLYALTPKGAEGVASELGVEPTDLRWNRTTRSPKDYYFLRHFLGTNDFRIALTLACRDNEQGIRLLGLIPEYYGERTREGSVGKYIKDFVCDVSDPRQKISHTPDAVFALERGGKPALFFLEIDRGTEVLSDIEKGFLKCVRFYLNYLIDGKYRRYETDFRCGEFKGFRTLLVTTSQARMDNMREVVGTFDFQPKQAKRFLWVSLQQHVTQEHLFQPIWRSLDSTDETLYQIG